MEEHKTNPLLLSILIPTKNRAPTCLYAIESALNLQGDNFEIVVKIIRISTRPARTHFKDIKWLNH
jgi:hypothetical protein